MTEDTLNKLQQLYRQEQISVADYRICRNAIKGRVRRQRLLTEAQAEAADLRRQLAAAHALIDEVANDEAGLPKGARYAIEWYRKENGK